MLVTGSPTPAVYVSASQVSRAKGCMRRWAWERVAPVPVKPEHQARLDLGTAVHAVGEAYTSLGTAPDRNTPEGRAFLPALPFIPAARHGQSEVEISMTDPPTLGFVDLLAEAWEMPGEWPGCAHVILDYKTKDSLTGKTMFEGAGDMLTDPQALTYAEWYFREHPHTVTVGMCWLYLRVNGKPGAKACRVIFEREQVREAFGRLVRPMAERLVKIRLSGPIGPLTLEPNPLECLRYGPRYACPYIKACNLTITQRVSGAMSATTGASIDMSLIDDLRAQFGDKGVNPPEGAAPAKEPTLEPAPALEQAPAPATEPVQAKRRASARVSAPAPEPEPVQAPAQDSPPVEKGAAFAKYSQSDLDDAMVIGLAVKAIIRGFRGGQS